MQTTDTDDFGKFIIRRTREHWESAQTPYLLTYISSDYQKETGQQYKSLIYPQSLKEFVGSLSSDVKIVQHPLQKPKVGLIPSEHNYTYGVEDVFRPKASTGTDRTTKRSIPPKYVVLNFLEGLAKLNDDEIDRVNLPLSVLVKMLSEK